jgi:hypothetical protein
MMRSVFASDLRAARRDAYRVADLAVEVVDPWTGRRVLEYGPAHQQRMVSGKMELPGGVEVIDGKVIREPGGGGTTVSLPVSFQLRSNNTGEVLNDGQTFTRNMTFVLRQGVYLSSAEGRSVLVELMRKMQDEMGDEYRGLAVEAVSLNCANGVEFQYGPDMPAVDLAAIRMRGGRFRYVGDDDDTGQCVIDCLVKRLAAISENDWDLGTLKLCGRSYFINWFETNLRCNDCRSWSVKDGVSCLDLAQWIRACGVRISLYGIDASGRTSAR